MTTVLVTGATGMLGSLLTDRITGAGYRMRAMSREPRPGGIPAEREWVRADLTTGEGLSDALDGAEAIIHSATAGAGGDPGKVDVEGTHRLIEALGRGAGMRHIIYPSIVGVDRIPLAYYEAKLRVEQELLGSGLPVTVVRATQFHEFVHRFIRVLGRLPFALVPAGFRVQSVDGAEYADHLVRLLPDSPSGRAPDFAGPEVLELREMMRQWSEVTGRKRLILSVPFPGRTARAFREGHATAPERAVGRLTWREWLERASSAP